ncbi:hypothetical protein BN2497_14157 [Janthinobacterium sp. CG23_2]|nr:hypothetical protein BN2497_14157 [Janthinobacterium sp. CG23_2]CUU33476.1 hypothetical protein BN3177_14157 [Janthinobacterium sp. CG23_2]
MRARSFRAASRARAPPRRAQWRRAAHDDHAGTGAPREKKSQTNAVCQLRTDKVFVYFT